MKTIYPDSTEEQHRNNSNTKQTPLSRTIIALTFIIAGLLIIAKRSDLITSDTFHMIFNWQVLLISIGVFSISKNKKDNIGGYIMILIGSIFLIPEFIDINYNTRELFFPAILIGVGVIILFKGMDYFPKKTKERFSSKNLDDINAINDNLMFGGGEYHITSNNFKGGSINAIFGGGSYNFRNSTLAEGIQILEVNIIFGGLELNIPSEWDVKLEVTSILGGFSNKNIGYSKPTESKGQLIIRGTAIFGGGELKRY
ncbi:MAG: hypothetical protein KAG84_04670 [Bacteroidales bacterium]|nr:hypothetical protein [Bacteroidales bacterium]